MAGQSGCLAQDGMPSSAPASVGPSVPDLCAERCSSCHKFCPLDLSYCCQTCARHWCIECLAAHLRLYAGFKPRSQPGSLHWPPGPAPVPCLGRPLGCSSNIPPDLVRSFQAEPLPANELSPSSSICSVETTMLHLPQEGVATGWPVHSSSQTLALMDPVQLPDPMFLPPNFRDRDAQLYNSMQMSPSMSEGRSGMATAARLPAGNFMEQGRSNFETSSAKKQICKYWFEGCCNKGSACQYAHGRSELRHAGAWKTRMCPALLKGQECFNGGCCTYAHHQSELVTHPSYKTRMCKFLQQGQCPLGKDCHYAHSASELRAPVTR